MRPLRLQRIKFDRGVAQASARVASTGHHSVHAQVYVIVEPAGRIVALTAEGEELVRVDVNVVQAVVSRGQLVGDVEGDGGEGVNGHKVAPSVQQTVAAS